jgi:hypothetical protein
MKQKIRQAQWEMPGIVLARKPDTKKKNRRKDQRYTVMSKIIKENNTLSFSKINGSKFLVTP